MNHDAIQTPPACVDDPIFLVGSTRSGTTLLSLILGHHPQISFVGEFEWVWDLSGPGGSPPLTSYHDWLSTHRHFRFHKLHIDSSLPFDDLVRSFLQQMRADVDPKGQRPHVGCQVHRNYRHALALWPQARFIHIVRDGRDVCASWMKLGWIGNAIAGGYKWRELIAEWSALATMIDPSRRIEIRHEDLVQFPERELARLCRFIGVEYAPEMMRYHEDTTYEPIDPTQVGKWRTSLSSRNVRIFEALTANELCANGYSLSGHPPYPLGPLAERRLWLESRITHLRRRIGNYGLRICVTEFLARRFGLESMRKRVQLQINAIENARIQ